MELETTMMWQAQFKSRYLHNDSSLLGAYESVLAGVELPNGTANAVMKGMELRLKASPDEIRALLVPRADVSVETKETHTLNVNITKEKAAALTPEQVADWLLTGVLPTTMTEIEDVIDAEFEDITGESEDEQGNNA